MKIKYSPDCKFIPSNILKAFIKSKKHKIVKKISNCFKSNIFLVKEKLILEIIKPGSRLIKKKISTSKNNNFLFASKLNLSSRKQKKNINIKKNKNKNRL